MELVGVASSGSGQNAPEEESGDTKLTNKCEVLQDKLTLLLRTLQIESEASSFLKKLDISRRSSTMENLDILASLDGKKQKWHSDSELSLPHPTGPNNLTRTDFNRTKIGNNNSDSSPLPGSGTTATLGFASTVNSLHAQNKKTGKQQKVFIPKEHLWSRANSLKKAMREIIDHTERGI